jgi:hypothetical protein
MIQHAPRNRGKTRGEGRSFACGRAARLKLHVSLAAERLQGRPGRQAKGGGQGSHAASAKDVATQGGGAWLSVQGIEEFRRPRPGADPLSTRTPDKHRGRLAN